MSAYNVVRVEPPIEEGYAWLYTTGVSDLYCEPRPPGASGPDLPKVWSTKNGADRARSKSHLFDRVKVVRVRVYAPTTDSCWRWTYVVQEEPE